MRGLSMSEQLRKERLKIEKSAIKDDYDIIETKPKRGRPFKANTMQNTEFYKLVNAIMKMEASDSIKLELLSALVDKLRGMV